MARATTMGVLAMLAGCGTSPAKPTTQPTTIEQRQDAALRDPANYKLPPTPGSRDDNGIGHLDGPGFNKDLNDVFNP